MSFNGINTGDFNASHEEDFIETQEHDRDTGDAPLPCPGATVNAKRFALIYKSNGFIDVSQNNGPYNKIPIFSTNPQPSAGGPSESFDLTSWLPNWNPFGLGWQGNAPPAQGWPFDYYSASGTGYANQIDYAPIIAKCVPVIQGADFDAIPEWNFEGDYTFRIWNGPYNPPGQGVGIQPNSLNDPYNFQGLTSLSGSPGGTDGGVNAVSFLQAGGIMAAQPNASIAGAVGCVGTHNQLLLWKGRFQVITAGYYVIAELIEYTDGSQQPDAIIFEGLMSVGQTMDIEMPNLGFIDSDYVNQDGSPTSPAPIGRTRFIFYNCNAYSFIEKFGPLVSPF